MIMKPLHPITRIILALAVLAMISGYYLPLWEIQLWAPQYPEGLNMKIWLNKLSGAFDIINGLNHYIGMKQIKVEMFPEFKFMGMILGFFIFMGLLPVILGRRIWLQVFVVILFLGGGLGILDFYRWGHDYGHNLDPKAAISVPGMTYDPPLIGYKSLLNFVAYSGPDKGGWVLIGAGVIASALLAWELYLARRRTKTGALANALLPLVSVLGLLTGCDTEPQAIEYGKDECSDCKMVIADPHYGAEYITEKGKVFKFDDINCMLEFMGREPARNSGKGKSLVVDFNRTNPFLNAVEAVFLKHEKLRSPMGSHLAAFASKDAAEAVNADLGPGGKILRWSELLETP
jgi:copper chaperone NosL